MSPNALPLHRRLAPAILPRRGARFERRRLTLGDGRRTTVHVASYELRAFMPRLVAFERPVPLIRWCREQGVRHAVVGGFFVRPQYAPLGLLRIDGERQAAVPFDAPWDGLRSCVHLLDGGIRIWAAGELLNASGDVLQAGPTLVGGGRRAIRDGIDPEGFSAGAHQFDSDITVGRYPRAALGVAAGRVFAVACDGRTGRDAGMTLGELADLMLELGATDAINLDGGGSASLVHEGRLRNRPREEHGVDLLEGRAIVTAIVFDPRRRRAAA